MINKTTTTIEAHLKPFKFVGRVYFYNAASKQKESIQTTLTIQAPSSAIARAMLNNYGMETMKIQF